MGIEVTKFWEIESNKKTYRFIFISSGNPSGKYYILEQQRERTLVKEQIYSDTDNLKFLNLKVPLKTMLVTLEKLKVFKINTI